MLTLVHLQCRAGSCPTVERTAVPDEVFRSQPKIFFLGGGAPPEGTWSTWSAVINLTSRVGELRSAPSEPDDRHRATG